MTIKSLAELLENYGPDGIAVRNGVARITGTWIPVFLLEALRQAAIEECDILFKYEGLRCVDLVNAWQYIVAHPGEIDVQIQSAGNLVTSIREADAVGMTFGNINNKIQDMFPDTT